MESITSISFLFVTSSLFKKRFYWRWAFHIVWVRSILSHSFIRLTPSYPRIRAPSNVHKVYKVSIHVFFRYACSAKSSTSCVQPLLSRDREDDVPECSGREISQIFGEKSVFREMAFGNADLCPVFKWSGCLVFKRY